MTVVNKLWNLFERILKSTVSLLLKIPGKELSDSQWQNFMQFVKFCLVGVSNTAISLGVYYIFVAVNSSLYMIGNAAGFVVSVLNSYILNSRFVFKKQDEKGKTLVKTFAAYGTNLIIGTLMLYLLVDIIGISEFIAPLINLLITVPLNYILNKKWVMK
ncbi:MAG: GtrA family protein [Oscillospiraceae bacterium]|nr:GtrA family protein [Oscillospiraceae bacterium]